MKTVWLIELATDKGPQWLTYDLDGFLWTGNAADAQLFYSSADAARDGWLACQSLDESLERFSPRVTITEHQFG